MSDARIEAVFDLSPQQLGMLFETLSSSVAGLHIEQFVYTIEGNLNPLAFSGAWQAVVDRHAILRTAFVWKDRSQPLQVVLRRAELTMEHQDWRALSEPEVHARLEEYLVSDRLKGFTLTKPPLIRLVLFQTSEDRHHVRYTSGSPLEILVINQSRPFLVFAYITGET